MAKKVLGKGLGAIISTSPKPADEIESAVNVHTERIVELETEKIKPNPDQPRTHFDDSEIRGLAESIKSVGLIQPIIVRKESNRYYVVAGERRLRASKSVGLKSIRAIVIEADEEKNLTMALIENIQRSDLDPIEEAKAYKVLAGRFKLKQSDIAERVGKERATVANSLRLLNLPPEIQDGLSEGNISTGHAKLLLSVSGSSMQKKLYKEILEKGYSVRGLEKIIADREGEESKDQGKKKKKEAHIRKMEDRLKSLLGTKVEIKHTGKRGVIEISYYSLDDFERILELLK
jgi:ParB family transcriptional regulator, chromosome partitioning protein